MKNLKFLAIAIAHLHNYCINERIEETEGGHPDPAVEARILGRVNDHDIAEEAAEVEAAGNAFNGMSFNREQMAHAIQNLGLERIQLGGAQN
jgi:hypothetical protein